MRARRDAELRAIAKLERDRLERGQADELAGALNEFFSGLHTDESSDFFDGSTVPDLPNYMNNSSSFLELPLSSPDSITVTTEFGVLEETGNVTIISAGGATHPYDTHNDDEENEEFDPQDAHHHNELHYQPLHPEDHGAESYVVMTEDTSAVPAPHPDWVTAIALQHQQQQNSWLLQQQMQQMYNVAMGLNTTPPPVMMPGPVMHHVHHFGDEELSDEDEDEHDTGEEADVDTDEVVDEAEVEGAMTPTASSVVMM
jgi:hypothetical protein